MQWTILPHKFDDSINEVLAFVISQRRQWSSITKVFGFVRITTRTLQRTFPCDLNRNRRIVSSKNASPRPKYFGLLHDLGLTDLADVRLSGEDSILAEIV